MRRRFRRLLLWALFAVLTASVLPVLVFSVVPVPTTAFMLQYQMGGWFDQRPPLRHDWVGWDEIADAAKLAVIAAEDQRFVQHHGVDLAAVRKAIEDNQQRRRTRGGSTISQQLAKNLFLWPARSWWRKGLEVYFTGLIELVWTKKRILHVYLNSVELGPGVYGVEAAAQAFFGKPASALGAREASLLAAVLPNPKRMSAVRPSAYVLSRARWIRRQMRQLGPETLAAME